MMLIATVLNLLVRADITHLSWCQYSDSNCTEEVICVYNCDEQPTLCSWSSCNSLKATYENLGMSEYGECFTNPNGTFMANCTGDGDEDGDKDCSDYDICRVFCTTNDRTCSGDCLFIGMNIVNGSNYNCDDYEIYSAMQNSYADFEDFDKCFTNTNEDGSGEDNYLICNMGGSKGSSKSTDWARIIVPIVSITAVYCCIWYVWRQSEADEKSFWKSRSSMTMSTFRGKKDTSTTATQQGKPGETTD